MDCNYNATEPKCPPKGRYANSLQVGYNAFEFVFDFGQAFSEEEIPRSCSRIVTSPGYAKAMITALQSALEAFEQEFGHIESGRHATEDKSRSMSKEIEP